MPLNRDIGFLSGAPNMVLPVLPSIEAATLLATQFQFQQSEWWTADQLKSKQMQQLHVLLSHLYENMPLYRGRLKESGYTPAHPLTPEVFRSIPIMSRAELQAAGENAVCGHPPPEHGMVRRGSTSGSTGRALSYTKTALTNYLWQAVTLREDLWSGWDLRGRLAVSRAGAKDGERANWGKPEAIVFETGPASVRNVGMDIPEQAGWLADFRPDYLITNPTNLKGLCLWFQENGGWQGELRGVRTLGEVVSHDLRELSMEVLGAPIRDMYSAAEVGYIALQCPNCSHYHAQSETVLVEILREDGSVCLPGEIGKVVITTLHNYAMPLIRYAIGDFAEQGEPCPCGRGLPTINRVYGRSRNLIRFPDGRTRWPTMPPKKYAHIGSIQQLQLVQKSLNMIEVRLVVKCKLDETEERALRIALTDMLKYPFELSLVYLDKIEFGPNYKFEDFISEII